MTSTSGSATHEPRPTNISDRAWAAAFQKFATAFPASFADDNARVSKKGLWTELVLSHPWITEDVFVAGMYAIAWKHKGAFLPEPATALDFFEAAKVKVDRETEQLEAELRAKLPPPKPSASGWGAMSGPQRAAYFERHLAIGKLKGQGIVDPTEQQIAGQVGQQRVTRFCQGTLEAIAAREDAPLAEIGKEVTGVWPR